MSATGRNKTMRSTSRIDSFRGTGSDSSTPRLSVVEQVLRFAVQSSRGPLATNLSLVLLALLRHALAHTLRENTLVY